MRAFLKIREQHASLAGDDGVAANEWGSDDTGEEERDIVSLGAPIRRRSCVTLFLRK
ncbi:hypothetical protein JOE11_000298 [Robbsia andropogonis]